MSTSASGYKSRPHRESGKPVVKKQSGHKYLAQMKQLNKNNLRRSEKRQLELMQKMRKAEVLVDFEKKLADQMIPQASDEQTFQALFDRFIACLTDIVKDNHLSLSEVVPRRHRFIENHAKLTEQYVTQVQQFKGDDFPWEMYSDYADFCADPPVVVSATALANGFKLAKDRAAYIADTSKCIAHSYLKYLESGAEKVDYKEDIIDLNNPAKWFPEARRIPRKVYLHIGPTNSGKTYTALQRFQNADSGFYAGPLRLLAREVYNRMKFRRKGCSLITGEEVIEELDEHGEPSRLASGTVEMLDLRRDMDVAVIDEIQMIEDRDRGWAWTNAFLGVRAKEVHLCGDPSSERLIRRLCYLTGDSLEIVKYNRLSPLEVDSKALKGKLGDVKPGDCIVAFSKRELFILKAEVERKTKHKCAVIYGSLPADTRAKQAMAFNDPKSDYKYLIASDAIGMGLNLAIRRIIFTTVKKFDGIQETLIPIAQTKQIAGRAGRYKVAGGSGADDPTVKESTSKAESGVGRVTALVPEDLAYIKKCLDADTPTITRAGLFPPEYLLREFAIRVGLNTPYYKILQKMQVSAGVSSWFFLTDISDMIDAAESFADIEGLMFEEMVTLSKAPVNLRNPVVETAFKEFCNVIARGEPKNLLEIPNTSIDSLLRAASSPKMGDTFESVHKVINLYLWLSYRFPNVLLDRRGAMELKDLCEERIASILTMPRRLKIKLRESTDEPSTKSDQHSTPSSPNTTSITPKL
ncbi:ATP-dependent RNA helicase Suv3p, mitochondrial [Trichomonascus vanleenenianus]|uniref:ATP-dependent RNA helicase SUV3 n=1 Tax=Trichomonascus vanleenenianus TaxID=2268995 RepID=UPI003ECA2311